MSEIQGIYSIWTLAKHLNNVTWEAISSYKTRTPGMELKRKWQKGSHWPGGILIVAFLKELSWDKFSCLAQNVAVY